MMEIRIQPLVSYPLRLSRQEVMRDASPLEGLPEGLHNIFTNLTPIRGNHLALAMKHIIVPPWGVSRDKARSLRDSQKNPFRSIIILFVN